MQLIALVVMLMLAGNQNVAQLKPIIEEFGGEEAAKALKQAEELSQMLSVVKSLSAPPPKLKQADIPAPTEPIPTQAHPLAPIKGIANEQITDMLSHYIALGD